MATDTALRSLPRWSASHRRLVDIFMPNSLIDAYSKAGQGAFLHAWRVFDEMPRQVVVSSNSMMAGLAKNGDVGGAREKFDTMPKRNRIEPPSSSSTSSSHRPLKPAFSEHLAFCPTATADLRFTLPGSFSTNWLASDARCGHHLFAMEMAIHEALLGYATKPANADLFFVPIRQLLGDTVALITVELPY